MDKVFTSQGNQDSTDNQITATPIFHAARGYIEIPLIFKLEVGQAGLGRLMAEGRPFNRD